MEYGTIPGIDKSVSRIVQGTVMLDEADPTASFALLDAAVEAGCTAFDTARHYGRGSEAVFGRWIRERGLRDQIMVLGKGAHHSAERRRVTPEDIAADMDESLRQFGFDHIDLYLLHRDDPSVPVGPIVEALDGHRRGGQDPGLRRLELVARAYRRGERLRRRARPRPVRGQQPELQPGRLGPAALGGVRLDQRAGWRGRRAPGTPPRACRSSPGPAWPAGFSPAASAATMSTGFTEYLDKTCIDSYGSDDNFTRLERAEELAKERGLSIPQIALAYVLNNPVNVFALVGCRTPQEFAENAAAVATKLTPSEVAWLELRQDHRAG